MQLNMRSSEILAWKYFLIGQGYYWLITDGEEANLFDQDTQEATINFQTQNGLKDDGIVGNATLSAAKSKGFRGVKNSSIIQPTYQNRIKQFGSFSYKAMPLNTNPENIVIDNVWVTQNIITISVPFGEKQIQFPCHKNAANAIKRCFSKWHEANLQKYLLTFDGCWVPRFVRGSRQYLSNHAWGTAFDINARYNQLGAAPVESDKIGTVIPLIPIAQDNGFFWGGNFDRSDGMHFELVKLCHN